MNHRSKKAPRRQAPHKQASRQLLVPLSLALRLASRRSAGVVYAVMPGTANLGSPEIGGSFTMIGQDGRMVTNADLAGRPYLVFFGYTHCPDFCPTALFDISAVFKEMGPDKKVAALFVTVDPERDTPDVLKTYLENFDSRIIGLTGDTRKSRPSPRLFVFTRKRCRAKKPATIRWIIPGSSISWTSAENS